MTRNDWIGLARAVVVTVVVVVLAGIVVEIVNHTGIITGLGFDDQIARALADAVTFSLAGFVLYDQWRD